MIDNRLNAGEGHDDAPSLIQNLLHGLLGGTVAAVIGVVLLLIGDALVGPIEAAMRPGASLEPISTSMVVAGTLLPGIAAGLVITALHRLTAKGTRVFRNASGALLLLSLFFPIALSGSAAAAIVLSILHVTTAASIVWALTIH